MKKLESVFSKNFNNKRSLSFIVLLFFGILIIAMSSVSAATYYGTYTDLSVNTSINVVAPGIEFNISGNLTNSSDDQPIKNKSINVTIYNGSNQVDSKLINTNLTDGTFNIPFTISNEGLYNVTISFAGDGEDYSPATVKMPLEVRRLAIF